ncbi:hypothetical protein ACVGW6_00160, partial [Enterobacter intestinihominis]
TGVYGNREHGEGDLNAGAKKVLFSHPGTHDLDATVVFGVNQHQLQAEQRNVSNPTCNTNSIIPVIKLFVLSLINIIRCRRSQRGVYIGGRRINKKTGGGG